MNSSQIRRKYLDYFKARGHAVRPSTPIIPQGDPTLMFNSAGMVPFKPYFLGLKKDLSRAASCQKCFRTTDIDRVGATIRHLTFFEMLGNFSFGDYFKEDSIAWAWEFLTKEMGLDPKLLHPTIFKDDEEAFALWKKIGAPNPTTRLGEDTNFWNMGPTGPCGPCSEIYIDRGADRSCGKADCHVGCDCDRYVEIWNLVFTQFDRQPDGSLKPLPRKNIDTGMGLERLAFAAQKRSSPFETDLFFPIVERAAHMLGVSPRDSRETELAFRVIADHARAAVMLMAEGVIPSNVERGYVLRRLIRRAVRYGQLLGHNQAFLHQLVGGVVEIYRDPYPELKEAAAEIAGTLKIEEEKFLETLQTGERELAELLKEGRNTLSGEQAFKLYDTFGFPLELTKEICAKQGVSVDEEGFKKAAEKASEVARASWKGSGEREFRIGISPSHITTFTGYESLEERARIVALELLGEGGVLVLEKTPFYPEGGGQIGDQGQIFSTDGKRLLANVADTVKQGNAILHILRLPKPIAPTEFGTEILAKVDAVRRNYIAPHHTATHLLNEALRRLLGAHVRQAGSYVGADKLRFDFTHPKGVDPETLRKLEAMVAEEIKKADPVAIKTDSIDKVKEYGAVTLLGEDYGDQPRFVLIGPKGWADPKDRYSLELCGGTHVKNTSELSAFRILKESSVAAGVRRIEALAGRAVEDYRVLKGREEEEAVAGLLARERALLEEAAGLGGAASELPASQRTASRLRVREKELKELVSRLKDKKLAEAGESGGEVRNVNGVRLFAQRFEGADPRQLRSLSDKIKAKVGSGLVFLAGGGKDGLFFILAATPDLASRGVDAAKIAKSFASTGGGSAGGRPEFAQGGIPDGDWDAIVSRLSDHLG